MRFPVDTPTRRGAGAKVGLSLTLALPLALGGCLFAGAGDGPLATAGTPVALIGPGADYPVVLGQAYTAAGTSYTPEDVMNYDEVGYLAADSAGGSAISAAHHTLPLPSYVEVTSLDTGRTILVRVERRGPMDGNQLLALSPSALNQLDAKAGTPVRVRRVNSPEEQRALLRAGQAAPLRMDTPMSLVAVLKRKLPGNAAASAPVAAPQATAAPPPIASPSVARTELPPLPVQPTATARPAAPVRPSPPVVAATARSAPAAAARAAPLAPGKGFVVQAAAFSSAAAAQQAAQALGGAVTKAGAYWRVRTGPFSTHSAAAASLAKVKAAGYSDARIYTN